MSSNTEKMAKNLTQTQDSNDYTLAKFQQNLWNSEGYLDTENRLKLANDLSHFLVKQNWKVYQVIALFVPTPILELRSHHSVLRIVFPDLPPPNPRKLHLETVQDMYHVDQRVEIRVKLSILPEYIRELLERWSFEAKMRPVNAPFTGIYEPPPMLNGYPNLHGWAQALEGRFGDKKNKKFVEDEFWKYNPQSRKRSLLNLPEVNTNQQI